MSRIYSLAYLTSAPMAPPDALVLAGKLGYQAIGARLAPAMPGGDFSPLVTQPAMLRETIRRIADTGVAVFDVEIVRLGADFKPDHVTNAELIYTARCARLLPGDGGIDLRGLLGALPSDLPLSLEIPNDEWLPKLGAEEWARRALAAARRIAGDKPSTIA